MPLLTPLTSQVVSDTSEASATARQTAATAWRQVICSGKGRDSDREHSGSGREHSHSGSGSGGSEVAGTGGKGCSQSRSTSSGVARRSGVKPVTRSDLDPATLAALA